jgi:LPS sulfotransferase NodH
MSERFVILTAPRSGSNMLVGLLEQHPGVRCFGELMRQTPAWYATGEREPRPESVLHVFGALRDRYPDDDARYADPYGFVEAAYATSPGGSHYGFKLHLHQQPGFVDRLVADRRYRLILLRRENVLAQYSSEKIAERTGQGAARVGDRVEQVKVRFDEDDFSRYREAWTRAWSRLMDRVRRAGRPALSVGYVELMAGGVGRVLEHLGLPAGSCGEPITLRRNDPCILNRFENPAEAERVLNRLGAGSWATEAVRVDEAPATKER